MDRGGLGDTFVDRLYPFHPVFTSWYFALLDQGFPLLKKLLLYRNHYDVPDLAQWKERVLAVAPDARVEVMERNLLRTAPDDELRRSFSITTGPDGQVRTPRRLQGPAMRRRDTEVPKDDDTLAFVVDAGGRLLRRTRLDELPQLWNVLRGDMTIVGPRPERPEFMALLSQEVPFWSQRLVAQPGITGWAQIRAPYSFDELGAEEKLSYDLWYLRHRSLALDTVICVKTVATLLTGAGAR